MEAALLCSCVLAQGQLQEGIVDGVVLLLFVYGL